MNTDILQQYTQYVNRRYAKYNTRHTYTDHIRVMFDRICKPYDEITQADLDEYVQYCLENKKTNGNAIRFWSIQRFIDWTKRTDLALPKITPRDPGKLALKDTEIQKILDIIETLTPFHRLIFYLEYDTIRRPNEIRKIKISDRYQDILAYDGKTGNKKAFMTRRLIQAWDEYVQHQRPIPQNETEAQYLFLSDYGKYKGRHYNRYTFIDRTIKEICMFAHVEIPQGQKPSNYLIKRTSITNQLKDCPDPKIIQLQAGHTKLQTTMKYNRVDDDHIRDYLSLFEDKSQRINGKKHVIDDKSFLPTSNTPVASLNKNMDEDEGQDNSSYTFTHYSFEQNHGDLRLHGYFVSSHHRPQSQSWGAGNILFPYRLSLDSLFPEIEVACAPTLHTFWCGMGNVMDGFCHVALGGATMTRNGLFFCCFSKSTTKSTTIGTLQRQSGGEEDAETNKS